MPNIRAEKCNHVGNAYDLVVKKGVKKHKHMKLLGTPEMIKKKKKVSLGRPSNSSYINSFQAQTF